MLYCVIFADERINKVFLTEKYKLTKFTKRIALWILLIFLITIPPNYNTFDLRKESLAISYTDGYNSTSIAYQITSPSSNNNLTPLNNINKMNGKYRV